MKDLTKDRLFEVSAKSIYKPLTLIEIDQILKYQEDAKKWERATNGEAYKEFTKYRLAYERLKKLQTHPYNFGERIMENLQFEIEAKTKFRSLLAGLIHAELQKILEKNK